MEGQGKKAWQRSRVTTGRSRDADTVSPGEGDVIQKSEVVNCARRRKSEGDTIHATEHRATDDKICDGFVG